MELLDYIVIALYAIALAMLAIWVSREPEGREKSTEDYFLAGRSLPWWAIGASLIAANISAEQITGQSGQGYAIGLAIAAYEWQAAVVLLVVAKYFLPIFLKREIFTMPQFLATRFGEGVKTLTSVYWIVLYTAVNLAAVLWLGGLAIESLTGLSVFYAMCCLAAFAVVYSIYGGLKAVALTDIVQVVILIIGGVAITFVVLNMVGGGNGPLAGLDRMGKEVPGHFSMILSPADKGYGDLPGIWTLLGGIWVLHFSYWGFNQYIIQRALGAESLGEAQKGLAFAAALKFLIPFIVVIPGIAALMLAQDGVLSKATLDAQSDKTYGSLIGLMPPGIRGVVFAALIAAIVSSLASMMNSISTIFTMDIYRSQFRKDEDEQHYVLVGRIVAVVAIFIALILAKPFLGGFESAFQTIQEYSGFVAPGVVAVFLLGFFYKKANEMGAYAVLLGSVLLSLIFYIIAGLEDPGALTALATIPFVIRIAIVFLAILAIGIFVSNATTPPSEDQVVDLDDVSFATSQTFNRSAIAVSLVLIIIYIIFW